MKIKRTHSLGLEEAKRRVDKISDSIGSRFDLSSEWVGDDLKFSGSGVKGRIAVVEDSVEVDVKLGLALMLLEGTVREQVESAMDKYLV